MAARTGVARRGRACLSYPLQSRPALLRGGSAEIRNLSRSRLSAGQLCSGASPDLSDLVPGLPASSSLANLRWRTGHLPDRAGCMKLNSTGIESSLEKMVSVSAYGRALPFIFSAFTLIRDAFASPSVDSALRQIGLCRRF